MLAVAAAVAVEARAVDQNVDLEYGPFARPIVLSPREPSAFWERFDTGVDRNAPKVFADRFHAFHVYRWDLESVSRDSGYFRDRTVGTARNALSKSIEYGMREAVVDLPVFLWLKDREGFLADLLRNSVGSVEEEAVAPLDVSYHPVERSWWEQLSESRRLRYGIRPFKTNPYAYLGLGFKDGDKLLLLANVRYHYDHFTDHRFEFALSLPLAYGLAIDFGTSYQIGRNGEEQKAVVKILKELKTGGIIHAGFEVRNHPTLFAGIAFPW